jgi:hypothetical protein
VIGTEVISIPNTLASGTAIQQGAIFCAVPSPNHPYQCSNHDTAIPIQVTGPAATVVDEIPPAFTSVPPDMTLDATSPAGAVGIYVLPTATDNAPGPVTVGCSPASNSTFAIGTTTVMCTATDVAGNSATETFQVTVINTLDSLARVTAAAVDKPGITHSLGAKLDAAIAAAATGDTSAMDGSLNAYINEVEAQSGKAIDAQTATDLEGLAALLMT